jgi:hypothetical protein
LKLFQIEEPDGTPLEAEGPGAAVGIALAEGVASIAIAVGGNAELLARLPLADPAETLRQLRGQAEKMLARPVTHAVIASDAAIDPASAGLVLLRLVPADVGALGAACLAEDLAPRPS